MYNFNNAEIYCVSSKVAITKQPPSFHQTILESIEICKNQSLFQNKSFSDLINYIVDTTKKNITEEHWNPNEMDGVGWYIGVNTLIVTLSRFDYNNSYDDLFKAAFNLYFQGKNPTDAYDKILTAEDIKRIGDYVFSHQDTFNEITKCKTELQNKIVDQLTYDEMLDIKYSRKNTNVITKLIKLAESKYAIDQNEIFLFNLCLSIGTIIKEYEWGDDYAQTNGVICTSKQIIDLLYDF